MSDLDPLEEGLKKNLIGGNPEDKGVGSYGGALSEPERHRQYVETARKLLEQDEIKIDSSVNKEIIDQIEEGNLKKIPLERLMNMAIKARPQRSEGKVEHVASFTHWILQVKAEEDKYNTIDVEKD